MIEPINLKERFGDRYRITFDEAYDPKHRPKDKLNPWMMEIPCERGTIYPDDDANLCVMIAYRPITAKKVGGLPGVELVQDGDHEKTFRFPVELFDAVAEIVRPRRKRHMTEANKEAARQRMQARWEQNPIPGRSQEARNHV